MGAWGHLAFDNDTANDWAYGLDGLTDLSLVESALNELADFGEGYLDQDVACRALAVDGQIDVVVVCRTEVVRFRASG